MTYEDVIKNKSLNDYLTPSFEGMVESVIMDNNGISTVAVKKAIFEKWNANYSVIEIKDCIFSINRKYSDEIGNVMIVFVNGVWIWKGDQ